MNHAHNNPTIPTTPAFPRCYERAPSEVEVAMGTAQQANRQARQQPDEAAGSFPPIDTQPGSAACGYGPAVDIDVSSQQQETAGGAIGRLGRRLILRSDHAVGCRCYFCTGEITSGLAIPAAGQGSAIGGQQADNQLLAERPHDRADKERAELVALVAAEVRRQLQQPAEVIPSHSGQIGMTGVAWRDLAERLQQEVGVLAATPKAVMNGAAWRDRCAQLERDITTLRNDAQREVDRLAQTVADREQRLVTQPCADDPQNLDQTWQARALRRGLALANSRRVVSDAEADCRITAALRLAHLVGVADNLTQTANLRHRLAFRAGEAAAWGQ